MLPNLHQQNSPLGQIDGSLSGDLIEELLVELLADGTDATATGLLLAEFLVEDGLELVELFAAGLVGADV